MNTVLLLMRVECGLRSRILWTFGAFVGLGALCIALMYASVGVAAQAGFGPSAGGLINVNMLIVPLVALMLGTLSVVRDRERGTLAYLGVQPLSIGQLFWSKWAALMVQLTVVVCGAFVALLVALAVMRIPIDVVGMAQFMLTTVLLAVTMGACGMLVSIFARSTPIALACALAMWLFFVVFADIGVMASALATHMPIQGLLLATAANPIEAYKIASICALAGSVDVLGPGGRLANDIFGASLMPVMITVLAAWSAFATLLGRWTFGGSVRA
jgi:ABC-type transport system involved in multi-copper enzyme maturation permease subunit